MTNSDQATHVKSGQLVTRRGRSALWGVGGVLLLLLALAGRARTAPGAALDLSGDGAEAVPVLRNRDGKLMLYNFRAVEGGVLYRSSGFPPNLKVVENGVTKRRPAAFADGQLFDFLRAHHIRTVVTMQEMEYFYAEEGYFQWWQKRTGYEIKVVSLSVKNGRAYDRDSAGGLRAAAKFLDLMKQRRPADGAVLIHCDAGKDRSGVAVAAYELWRNAGKTDRETLWQQVRRRYLASNAAILSDKETAAWAGADNSCRDAGNGKPGTGAVCGEWLDKLRSDLELLAQL